MPSLLSKILHRKPRSGSTSSASDDAPESRHQRRASLPHSKQGLTSPSAPALPRKSMDDRRDRYSPSPSQSQSQSSTFPTSPTSPTRTGVHKPDVTVSPVRPAPPPPNKDTIVIDPSNDPHTLPSASFQPSYLDPSLAQPNGMSPTKGNDAPYRIPFNISTPGFEPSLYPLPPGAAHSEIGTNGADQQHLSPHQLSNSQHEIKDVQGRVQRPIMNSPGSGQSIEAELGRRSTDTYGRTGENEQRNSMLEMHQEEVGYGEEARKSSDTRMKQTSDSVDVPPRGASLFNGAESNAAPLPAAGHEQEGVLVSKLGGLKISGKNDGKTLEEHRKEMVEGLFASAKANKQHGPLSEQGIATFGKANMAELVGKQDTVEIKTKWLKPIVQETIIPRIHTIYTTIIDRHLHHHHVYPKIQPIEDPNPVSLPPLHRIFSPATGKWHEVEGDEAAIAILGEDVFHNGPKEVRHKRTPFTLQMHLEEEAAQKGTVAKHILHPLTEGMTEEEMLAEGFGTGGKGRVVEREGILGQKLSDWKHVSRGNIFGHHREGHREEEKERQREVGVAM